MTVTTDNAQDVVRFVLDGEVIELDNPDPVRTVLRYLREDLHRTGTKEGCAEGDCGACTVVVADAGPDGRLRARAINSCIQFLPTIDGKELITVESLRGRDGTLHPVQQAMVDEHGSQCGFCTPGFVMSLFTLFKQPGRASRADVDDALAGNLCRCTGYRPIIDAAHAMYAAPVDDSDWLRRRGDAGPGADERQRLARLGALRDDRMLSLAHHGRRFFAPRTSDELAELAARYPDAVLLAGGTDVGLWVTKQYREPDTVLYTGRVAELGELSVTATHLHVGAAVTLSDAMPFIVEHFPALRQLLHRFASPPIRNAATLGGNVANGSPIGDTMPALLATDTVLRLRSRRGSREVSLDDFYIDYGETALEPGEFIEQLFIPLCSRGDHLQAYKVSKRFDQDISAVCGAFRLCLDERNCVEEVRIAYGGLAAIPKRARACEQACLGREFSEATIYEAMGALDDDYTPISDMRASDEYRRRICKNLLLRFYRETALRLNGRTPVGIYEYGRHGQA